MPAHLRRMVAAASRAREGRMLRRLTVLAPGIDPNLARRLYEAGYKAGHEARRRGAATV